MLGGFKFAIQGGLRPVYRRPRFDYGESLLSGPAWAGVLAVLFARRNALRAWLGEGAARYAVVGALATGLGIQASTTPSAAQSAAKGHAATSHSAAAKPTAVGRGLAAGVLLSEADGDHRTDDRSIPATTAPRRSAADGGQSRRLSIPGVAAATPPGDQIDLFGAIGLFDLSGAGSSVVSTRAGNAGPASDSKPTANSGEPGSASDSPASGSFASGSSGSSTDDALTDAGSVFAWWPPGLPMAVLPEGAGSGSTDIASGSAPDGPSGSARLFDGSLGQAQDGGGSADVGAPIGAPPVSSDIPGPDAAPETVRVTGPVTGGSGGLGGVPEVFRVPGPVSGRSLGVGGVPEPATWATMLVGLALIGRSARQRRARA